MRPDTIAEAVLAREDVARFLEGSHGLTSDTARTRVMTYLEELRTTQRYELYRALEYPLYPILRKIERVSENQQIAVDAIATRCSRVWPSIAMANDGGGAGRGGRPAHAASSCNSSSTATMRAMPGINGAAIRWVSS